MGRVVAVARDGHTAARTVAPRGTSLLDEAVVGDRRTAECIAAHVFPVRVVDFAGEDASTTAEIAEEFAIGRDGQRSATALCVSSHGERRAQDEAVAVEGNHLALEAQNVLPFATLEGGDEHNIGMQCAKMGDVFREIGVIADEEAQTQTIDLHNGRLREGACVAVVHFEVVHFTSRQMLLAVVTDRFALRIIDARQISEHAF